MRTERTVGTIKTLCRVRDGRSGIWVLGKMLWLMWGTFDVQSVVYGLLPRGSSLSDRKRNQSLYQPLVWDQLPLPVSLALGDLKSYFKKEAADHDRCVITYKHALIRIIPDTDSLHAHIQHTLLYLPDWTWQAAPLYLLSVSFWRGWGWRILTKMLKAPEVCTSSGSHWHEKPFINTWPGWTGCSCKRGIWCVLAQLLK